MTRKEIFSYIESFCQDNSVDNDRAPDARGNGYHFFKKRNLYWAWYGTLWNGENPDIDGKLRIDFVCCPEKSIRDEIYASIKEKLRNKGYKIEVLRTALHIFFVRDIKLESVNKKDLEDAMCKYKKFMKDDFPSVKEILQKEKYESA